MESLSQTNHPAPSLCDVADRLKQVKDTYRAFLTLWAADQLLDDGRAMDGLIRDLDEMLEENSRTLLYQPRPLDD
jgi:hypothetical protein